MRILENRIRRIVSETLNRFIINETFTNMKQLYHRMPLDSLVNMIRVDSFYLMPSNHDARGGKYYASLSRHKNNIEGFDAIDYAACHDNYIGAYATITFNIEKLSRVHGISIRSFDFYATLEGENEYSDDPGTGKPSKLSYQFLKKPTDKMSDEEMDKLCYYDNTEYYNMAEENIVSDTLKEIPDIFNYIDRIDVYIPSDYEDPYYFLASEPEMFDANTLMYLKALCKIAIGTEWENKIVVNDIDEGKVTNMCPLKVFDSYINNLGERYDKKTPDKIINKKPIMRDDFFRGYVSGNDYYGSYKYGDDYGSYDYGNSDGYGYEYGNISVPNTGDFQMFKSNK